MNGAIRAEESPQDQGKALDQNTGSRCTRQCNVAGFAELQQNRLRHGAPARKKYQ